MRKRVAGYEELGYEPAEEVIGHRYHLFQITKR